MARYGIVGLCLGLFAGCSSTPIELPATYRFYHSTYEPQVAEGRSDGCSFNVDRVSDLRGDPHLLGILGNKTVVTEDFPAWIRSGLKRTRGYREDAADVSLDVMIVKAYIHQLPDEKAVDIVTSIRYFRNGVEVRQRTYRGADASVNWANGIVETWSSFDRAFAKTIRDVDKELTSICSEQQAGAPGR